VCSVESYDTKNAAVQLQDCLSVGYIDEFEDFFAGVLYDPCSDVINTEAAFESEERREELRQETAAKARAELAAQVKDFFAWLEDQGIL